MAIRFGTQPIAWTNDDDRSLGAHISLEQCLTEAKAAGFDGIEKGHKMPNDPVGLASALYPHGLAFVSAWHSTNLLVQSMAEEKAALQAHINLLKPMGCAVWIACETSNAIHGADGTPLSQRATLPSGDWAAFAKGLNELAKFSADQGLDMVYHHHMGTIVQTGDEIARLMDETSDDVKLLLDTGHATFGGSDPVKLYKTYAGRIRHIHCKNVRPKVMAESLKGDWSFLESVRQGIFTVPGDTEGGVDFKGVLAAAAEAKYRGWVVVEAEQDPSKAVPLVYQTLGAKTLRGLAHEVGLVG